MTITQFPLVRISIGFVAGIIVSGYLNPNPKLALVLFSALLFLAALSHFLIQKQTLRTMLFACTTYLLSLACGMVTQAIHNHEFIAGHYIQFAENEEQYLRLTLREKLKNTAFSERYVALVSQINGKNCKGKILANFYLDDSNAKLHIGSRLIVKGKVVKHRLPNNPGQFDYGNYLARKSIAAQLYVSAKDVKASTSLQKDIWYYSDRFRNNIISNLKGHFRAEELQVLNALILGQQQDIAPDILRNYQYAGAVHILSVSGLHVGFILLFLNFMLKPLPKSKRGRIAKFIIILFCLWGFAIIAGLSPSVVRSVTMFSFVALGLCLRKSTNIFHTLVVSILLILLFQPSFVYDVGFQLSYIALFFILWLQPMLSGFWKPQNDIVKYFWDILTVSFAAQLGAFPLSIYYFHQFPGSFFLTNLIVIPFVTIIMALGVLVMAMAAFGYVPMLPAKILEWCIHNMNLIIGQIASFEKFIIKDVPLNFNMLVALYAFIFSLILWLKKPSFTRIVTLLAILLGLQTAYFTTRWKTAATSEMIVFHLRKHTLVAIRKGKSVTFFYRDTIPENKIFQPYLTTNFCETNCFSPLRNLLAIGKNKIFVIDSTAIFTDKLNPDILLLTQSPKINLERIIGSCSPKMIVVDGSNFKSYASRWRETCAKEKIPYHFTNDKGFYKLGN